MHRNIREDVRHIEWRRCRVLTLCSGDFVLRDPALEAEMPESVNAVLNSKELLLKATARRKSLDV
jgi:hypothetical protein